MAAEISKKSFDCLHKLQIIYSRIKMTSQVVISCFNFKSGAGDTGVEYHRDRGG